MMPVLAKSAAISIVPVIAKAAVDATASVGKIISDYKLDRHAANLNCVVQVLTVVSAAAVVGVTACYAIKRIYDTNDNAINHGQETQTKFSKNGSSWSCESRTGKNL